MKATKRLPAERSRDEWLADFLSTLTAILGGKVLQSPDLAWRSGNYLVRSAPPDGVDAATIVIEVAHDHAVLDATFVYKRRDDPLVCGRAVARWLHEQWNH